jgi:hypothetical protein
VSAALTLPPMPLCRLATPPPPSLLPYLVILDGQEPRPLVVPLPLHVQLIKLEAPALLSLPFPPSRRGLRLLLPSTRPSLFPSISLLSFFSFITL